MLGDVKNEITEFEKREKNGLLTNVKGAIFEMKPDKSKGDKLREFDGIETKTGDFYARTQKPNQYHRTPQGKDNADDWGNTLSGKNKRRY